jgi:uncharacterized protein (TIGR03643 family)
MQMSDHIPAKLTVAEIDRIIQMAWEDRTPFEAIEFQFGLRQGDVISLMRSKLKHSSFKCWRARTAARKTKHTALRNAEVTRFKSYDQKS